MSKWEKLAEKFEEKIKDKIEEAIEMAYESPWGIISVVLHEDGDVYVTHDASDSTTDGEVWAGRAIYIVSFDANDYHITNDLYDLEKEDAERIIAKECNGKEYFDKYIQDLENSEEEDKDFDARDIYYDYLPPEIQKLVYEDLVDAYVYYYFTEYYDDLINNLIKELEEENEEN
jgi:hypothetical protein